MLASRTALPVHHLRTANEITDFHLRELGEEERDFSTEFKGKK